MEIVILRGGQFFLIGMCDDGIVTSYWCNGLAAWVPEESRNWATIWSNEDDCSAFIKKNSEKMTSAVMEHPPIIRSALR